MRYLIPEFTGLGDFIQKTPMIRTIKELDNEAVILIIGDNRWLGLESICNSDLIDKTCNVVDLLGLEVPKNHTNQDFETVYSMLTNAHKKRLSQWLIDSKWDIYLESYEGCVPKCITLLLEGFQSTHIFRHVDTDTAVNLSFFDWLKSRMKNKGNVTQVPILNGRHNIDANFDLLEAYIKRPIDRIYDTWVSIGTSTASLTKWNLKKHGYICIQPGAASGAPTPKTWHPKNFIELSRRLINSIGVQIVLLGDAGDFENIIQKFHWPEGVINTAGKTTIRELGCLLEHSAGAVVHDSGIMHIANSMSVPLIALFGPTDYTRTRPLAKTSSILYSYTNAFAVMYGSTKSERQLANEYPDHLAMSGLSVDEVNKAVVEMYRQVVV